KNIDTYHFKIRLDLTYKHRYTKESVASRILVHDARSTEIHNNPLKGDSLLGGFVFYSKAKKMINYS
ncbi:hypothetical protein, partial [Lactobacillus crispatus]|uniref:hypothetical protein n=1 Tax=Lactobacillus crispatus TaxID=47770 RepID=UPI001C5DDB80